MSRVWVSCLGATSSPALTSSMALGDTRPWPGTSTVPSSRSIPGKPSCPGSCFCPNASASAASLPRRARSRWSADKLARGSEVCMSCTRWRAAPSLDFWYSSYSALVVMTEPSGNATGVNGSAVYPNSCCPAAGFSPPGAGVSLSSPNDARRALRPMVMSTIKLASAPTPAPYAPSSPEPAMIGCSGSYTPLAIKFWAIFCAASVAPSMPPRASAVPTKLLNGLIWGASMSSRPVGAPSSVAVERSSLVAPLASAPSRASPAPAATPRPLAATRPTIPRGPAAKNGRVEPKPSPNLRPTESS